MSHAQYLRQEDRLPRLKPRQTTAGQGEFGTSNPPSTSSPNLVKPSPSHQLPVQDMPAASYTHPKPMAQPARVEPAWYCHACAEIGGLPRASGMSTAFITQCYECGHIHCEDCPVEEVNYNPLSSHTSIGEAAASASLFPVSAPSWPIVDALAEEAFTATFGFLPPPSSPSICLDTYAPSDFATRSADTVARPSRSPSPSFGVDILAAFSGCTVSPIAASVSSRTSVGTLAASASASASPPADIAASLSSGVDILAGSASASASPRVLPTVPHPDLEDYDEWADDDYIDWTEWGSNRREVAGGEVASGENST